MKLLFITTYILLYGFNAYAQTVCEKLKQQKAEIYGFKPSTLTDKQKEEKSKRLDAFWSLAKENKSESIGCLNEMILAETKDSFFCFDAASLLLQLDENQDHLRSALELKSVRWKIYN